MPAIESTIGNFRDFLTLLFQNLSHMGIGSQEITAIDHIAYRVSTAEEYEEMKRSLERYGVNALEEEVAGRPISLFRLHEPLEYGAFSIGHIELPAQKAGSPYPTGLEHADLTIAGTLSDFMKSHPGLSFETTAMNKLTHAEIGLKLPGANAKFSTEGIGEYIKKRQS